jgi:hypothetical protein
MYPMPSIIFIWYGCFYKLPIDHSPQTPPSWLLYKHFESCHKPRVHIQRGNSDISSHKMNHHISASRNMLNAGMKREISHNIKTCWTISIQWTILSFGRMVYNSYKGTKWWSLWIWNSRILVFKIRIRLSSKRPTIKISNWLKDMYFVLLIHCIRQ